MSDGPGYFKLAERMISYAEIRPKDPDLAEVIVAIRGLTAAVLAQAAATAALIEDEKLRKPWGRIV